MKMYGRLLLGLNIFGMTSLLNWSLFSLWMSIEVVSSLLTVFLILIGGFVFTIGAHQMSRWMDRYRVLPRKSDFLIAGGMILIAALAQACIAYALTQKPVYLSSGFWLLNSVVTFVAYCGYYFRETQLLTEGIRKKKVVVDLLPNERAQVIAALHASGILGYLEILGPVELREYFLKRNEHQIDQIIISRGAVRHFNDEDFLMRAHLAGITIVDRRELLEDLTGRIRLSDLDSWSFLISATSQTPFLRAYAHLKVFAEPILAILMAVALLPVFAVVALMIKISSPGPILYRQRRGGYLGKPFDLIKFRSMRTDSESSGARWATDNDDRVTPIGRIMRKTRLDELPQLWNVARGEMSFIGPRPERPEFYDKLKQDIPLFKIRTSIRPGISGWAQVCAGYAASVEESRTKLEFDLYYIKHVSPWIDTLVLIKTLIVAVTGSERIPAAPSSEGFDDLGGVPGKNAPSGVLSRSHDSAGRYDASVANSSAFQDRAVRAHPDVVANGDGLGRELPVMSFGVGNLGVARTEARTNGLDLSAPVVGVYGMRIEILDKDVPATDKPLADTDRPAGGNADVSQNAALPDLNRRLAVGLNARSLVNHGMVPHPNPRRRLFRLKTAKSLQANILAQVNSWVRPQE